MDSKEKKHVNIPLSTLLNVSAVIIIPCIIWGVSLEVKITNNKQHIETIREVNKREKEALKEIINRFEDNMKNLQKTNTKILIELQRKMDF